jgi:5-methylthioadenosine/S-adenosylhomocysteine deaminase
LSQFKTLADRLDARFHFHLAEAASSEQAALAAGFEGEASRALALGLLDERTAVAHGVWIKAAEMSAVARSGCHVAHCPTSNQILASGIAEVPAMLTHGVQVALGTDGASSNDSQDMFAEQKMMALIHRATSLDPKAVSTKQAFRAATEGGAQALGLERVGRIAAGWAADLIGIRLAGNPCLMPCNDPLATVVYQACGRDVSLNMVDGRILYQDGVYNTIDVDGVIDRVSEAREKARSAPQPAR